MDVHVILWLGDGNYVRYFTTIASTGTLNEVNERLAVSIKNGGVTDIRLTYIVKTAHAVCNTIKWYWSIYVPKSTDNIIVQRWVQNL